MHALVAEPHKVFFFFFNLYHLEILSRWSSSWAFTYLHIKHIHITDQYLTCLGQNLNGWNRRTKQKGEPLRQWPLILLSHFSNSSSLTLLFLFQGNLIHQENVELYKQVNLIWQENMEMYEVEVCISNESSNILDVWNHQT